MASLMSALRANVNKGGKIKFQHWVLFQLYRFKESGITPPDVIPGPLDAKGRETLDIHLRCVRCRKPNTSLLEIEIDTFSRLRQLTRKHKVCASCREKASEHAWKSNAVVYRARFSGPRALGNLQSSVRTFDRYTGVCVGQQRHKTFDKKSE